VYAPPSAPWPACRGDRDDEDARAGGGEADGRNGGAAVTVVSYISKGIAFGLRRAGRRGIQDGCSVGCFEFVGWLPAVLLC
jgi:hypothetical protein